MSNMRILSTITLDYHLLLLYEHYPALACIGISKTSCNQHDTRLHAANNDNISMNADKVIKISRNFSIMQKIQIK